MKHQKYANHHFVSEAILKHAFNLDRYSKDSKPRASHEDYLAQGLKAYYTDFDTFRQFHKNLSNNRAEQYWKEYLARDELVALGIYKDIRIDEIRSSYLETLDNLAEQFEGKGSDFVEELRYNLEEMSNGDFEKLITVPNNRPDKMDKLFFTLSVIYNLAGADEDTQREFSTDLHEVFDSLGIPWKTKDEPTFYDYTETTSTSYEEPSYMGHVDDVLQNPQYYDAEDYKEAIRSKKKYDTQYRKRTIGLGIKEHVRINKDIYYRKDKKSTPIWLTTEQKILVAREERAQAKGRTLFYTTSNGEWRASFASKEDAAIVADYFRTRHK